MGKSKTAPGAGRTADVIAGPAMRWSMADVVVGSTPHGPLMDAVARSTSRWSMLPGALRFARMSGSSIAAPDAAGWVTDFLNAAYYARPEDERDIDDLRLAFAVVTTYWLRETGGQRRLHLWDALALHRSFGHARFLDVARSPRGLLSRDQLLEGGARLLGPWFPEAYVDDARRAWGIAFPTEEERARYDPGLRLRHGRLGKITPPSAPPQRQVWHTYRPVETPCPEALLDLLRRPETWPDDASELGCFTPVRPGGLDGQTFEIEVVARVTPRTPVFTRGYVTVTALHLPGANGGQDGLDAYVAETNEALARYGDKEPLAVPAGATPLLGLDLTTHAGHFLGRACSKILLYRYKGTAYLREVGVWDPMDWYVYGAYRGMGARAQRAFWGMGAPTESMLHQMAARGAAVSAPTALARMSEGQG